jgi:hypothetical protein
MTVQIVEWFQKQEGELMNKKFTLSSDAALLGRQELEGLAAEVQGDLGQRERTGWYTLLLSERLTSCALSTGTS